MNAPLWDDAGFVIDTLIPNIPNRYDLGSASSPFRNIYANAVVVAGSTLRIPAYLGKAGATAGFVASGVDTSMVTVPAGVTAGTFIIPVVGVKPGDTLNGYSFVGQAESGGNALTIDAQLHKVTAVAAGSTDTNLGSMVQVSVTADTLISSANATHTLATPYVVTANDTFYLLVTVTTGASTDLELLAADIDFDQA